MNEAATLNNLPPSVSENQMMKLEEVKKNTFQCFYSTLLSRQSETSISSSQVS